MSNDLININVIIADRPYPLKIKQHEEESVRKAAKLINEKVKDFRQVYAAKDKQDYLAMCSLLFAVDSVNSQGKSNINASEIDKELQNLDTILSSISSNQ